MTSTLGYSDVTFAIPTENRVWHQLIIVGCMTSLALIYATQKIIKIAKIWLILCLPTTRAKKQGKAILAKQF